MLVRGYMIGAEVRPSRTRAGYRGIGLCDAIAALGKNVSARAQPGTTTSERPHRQPDVLQVAVTSALSGLVRQTLHGGRPVAGQLVCDPE